MDLNQKTEWDQTINGDMCAVLSPVAIGSCDKLRVSKAPENNEPAS